MLDVGARKPSGVHFLHDLIDIDVRVALERLAKMSDGTYCIIRDLGLVKGGRGLKHHENLLSLSLQGIWSKLVGILRRQAEPLRYRDRPEVALARLAGSPEGKRARRIRL